MSRGDRHDSLSEPGATLEFLGGTNHRIRRSGLARPHAIVPEVPTDVRCVVSGRHDGIGRRRFPDRLMRDGRFCLVPCVGANLGRAGGAKQPDKLRAVSRRNHRRFLTAGAPERVVSSRSLGTKDIPPHAQETVQATVDLAPGKAWAFRPKAMKRRDLWDRPLRFPVGCRRRQPFSLIPKH